MTRTTGYSLMSPMLAALAACVLMTVVIAVPAQAATFTVNTAADEQNTNGQCSLREAIINANANDQSGSVDCPAGAGEDTINFDPSLSGQTITLASQLPAVTDSAGLTIAGGGANITISGNRSGSIMIDGVRVFLVDSSGKLTLDGLTVTNGSADVGGGIRNAGTLTVSNSTISDHLAGIAGGIQNDQSGTLTVSNSTISGNMANTGGGIYNSGGTLTVSNSTIANNGAFIQIGGIYGAPSTTATTKLTNTIVANNTQYQGPDCAGTITDGGYNLDSGTSCGFGTANNSLSGVDPKLGALADNGGPTKTHALLAGSPAIDRGNSFGATTDQRGVARPQGAAPDIGAFELVDTISPSGMVLINNGAARTNGTAVTLKLSATDPAPDSGVAQMRFSNNGSTWSGWEPYATIKEWTLGSANGTKTVYAQFKDGAGNVSGAAQDTVVLDTVKPKVSTATPTGTGIGRDINVEATFSERMSPTSITNSTFKLYKVTSSGTTQVTNVTVRLSSDGLKATLNPFGSSTTQLARNTKYKAVVTTGAKDSAGNRLDQNPTTSGNQPKAWTFTTGG